MTNNQKSPLTPEEEQRARELYQRFKSAFANMDDEKTSLTPEEREIAERVFDRFGNSFVNLTDDEKKEEDK